LDSSLKKKGENVSGKGKRIDFVNKGLTCRTKGRESVDWK